MICSFPTSEQHFPPPSSAWLVPDPPVLSSPPHHAHPPFSPPNQHYLISGAFSLEDFSSRDPFSLSFFSFPKCFFAESAATPSLTFYVFLPRARAGPFFFPPSWCFSTSATPYFRFRFVPVYVTFSRPNALTVIRLGLPDAAGSSLSFPFRSSLILPSDRSAFFIFNRFFPPLQVHGERVSSVPRQKFFLCPVVYLWSSRFLFLRRRSAYPR